MQLLRHQHLEIQATPVASTKLVDQSLPLSRAQRAHYRLSWAERLARNARAPTAGLVSIKLFGVPEALTIFLGLPTN